MRKTVLLNWGLPAQTQYLLRVEVQAHNRPILFTVHMIDLNTVE